MADDRLSGAVAPIRERAVLACDPEVTNLVRNYRAVESARDVPRLLAAVDAVLKLAEGGRYMTTGLDSAGNPVRAWVVDAGMIREAVARALAGEEKAGE